MKITPERCFLQEAAGYYPQQPGDHTVATPTNRTVCRWNVAGIGKQRIWWKMTLAGQTYPVIDKQHITNMMAFIPGYMQNMEKFGQVLFDMKCRYVVRSSRSPRKKWCGHPTDRSKNIYVRKTSAGCKPKCRR